MIKWLLSKFNPKKRVCYETKFITNIKKDVKDSRDYTLNFVNLKGIELPEKFDLEEYCPPLRDQGDIGSCGSHAFISAIEIMRTIRNPNQFIDLSELFHYYVVRDTLTQTTEDTDKDDGQSLREGASILKNIGVAPEVLWAYDVTRYKDQPSNLSYVFARLFRIKAYYRLYNLFDVQKAICNKQPVVFGLWVDNEFIQRRYNRIVSSIGPHLIGGHAMTVIGYDNINNRFLIRGSWGENHREIPYDVFRENLIDMWCVEI